MFFNKPSPNDKKAGQRSTARGVMRFLFHPELGRTTNQISVTFQMFVQMLALLFLSNGMLDRSHRFFQPNAQFTLGDLFSETYARFDWKDKTKMAQNIFFVATWGLLASVLMWLVIFVLSLIAGASPAHAQGMFQAPPTDRVANVIDELALGNQLSGALGGPTTGLLQQILRGMMEFYSKAMLVFASLMLLYHVVNIVISSAWSGKPLDGADQIWAPLRLVLAIGLLVPLSTGMNSAQYGVLQIAKIGSGLASNVWAAAAAVLAPPTTGDLPFTPSARMAQMVHDMTMIRLCQTQMNEDTLFVSSGDGNMLTGTGAEVVRGFPNWFGQENKQQIKYGAGSNQTLCGSISWPVPNASASAASAPPGTEAIMAARTTILTAIDEHFRKIDDAVCAFANTVFIDRWAAARNITPPGKLVDNMYDSSGWNSTYLFNSMDDPRARNKCNPKYEANVEVAATKVKEAIAAYDTAVKAAANTAYRAVMTRIASDLSQPDPLGWMAAGSRYMRIAMAQKQIHDIADASPTVQVGNIFTQEVNRNQLSENNGDGVPRNQKRFLRSVRGMDSQDGVTGNTNYSSTIIAALQRAYGLNQPNPPALTGVVADLPALQPKTYEPQASMVSQAGDVAGPLQLVIDGLSAVLSVDRDTFTKLIVPNMADPLPNLFAFGHALYWISITLMLASIIPGVLGITLVIGPMLFPIAIGLAFFLPLLPMIRFFSATLAWLMAVLEALIGMPLFALAHLSPKGQGIMGEAARGYQMLFSIALRPVLLIFGLIASMIMLSIGMYLLNYMYQAALTVIWGEGKVFVITSIVLALIYALNAMAVCNGCFKIIDEVADKSMQWGNIQGYGFSKVGGDIDENAVLSAVNQGVGMIKGGLSSVRKATDAGAAKLLGQSGDGGGSGGGGSGGGGSGGGGGRLAGPKGGNGPDGDGGDDGGPRGGNGPRGGAPKTNFLGRQGARIGRAAGNAAGAIGSRVGGIKLPPGKDQDGNATEGTTLGQVGAGIGNRVNAMGRSLQNVKEDREAMRGRQDRVENARNWGAEQRANLQQQMASQPEMREAKDAVADSSGQLISRSGSPLTAEQAQFRQQWDAAQNALRGRMEMGASDSAPVPAEGAKADGGLAKSERATVGGLADYAKAAGQVAFAKPGEGGQPVDRKLENDGKPAGGRPAAADPNVQAAQRDDNSPGLNPNRFNTDDS